MKAVPKWVRIGVVVGIGMAVLWGARQVLRSSTPAAGVQSAAVAAPAPPRPPMRVSAVVVRPTLLAEVVTSTGTLRADEGVELQAEINGKVVGIHFTEGSRVQAGDLLVKLNDADLRASHARVTFRRELTSRRERRMAMLLQEGISNQEEYDTVMSELDVLEADLTLIEAQIAKTEIRAPFDGIVGLRYVSLGAFVSANTRIATLQNTDNLKVDFSVPERYAGRIRMGSPIRFSVVGFEERFEGEIYAFDPRIESSTRTLLLRAVCPNPRGRLLPGAFASVEFTLDRLEDAILVPSVAVVPGLVEKNVFVVVDGKAERRAVETGTRTEVAVQILSGLKPGDIVLTSGIQQMRAGLAVQPLFANGNGPSS